MSSTIGSPTVLLAFAAGLVSFISPCCLPLVPGYLAAVSGSAPADVGARRIDLRVVGRSALFVASFSVIFVLLGLTATAIGSMLFENQLMLRKVAGVAILAMGALFIGSAFVTRLNRDWRMERLAQRAGRGGPVVAGIAFAIAWTPCVGPTLGAILGLASTQQSTAEGAGLLAVYSAGLGVPFLLTAVGFNVAQGSLGWVRRRFGAIQIGAGAVLMLMGALVFTDELFRLNIEVQQALDGWDLNFFQSV